MKRTAGTTNRILLFGLIIISLGILSCGGVQRNPATPPWGQNPNQPGPQPGAPQAGGAEAGKQGAAGQQAWGEGKILEGDYDSLMAQASGFLETGDLQGAYNAYFSAYKQKPADAQAGFGMSVIQLALNWRTFAVFTSSGNDKLFYGTPLMVHPEIIPSPLRAEDSYLLRIFTIGQRYEENFKKTMPSWAVNFNAKKEGDASSVTPPPGTPGEPDIKPVKPQGNSGTDIKGPGGEVPLPGQTPGPGGQTPQPNGVARGAASSNHWPSDWEPLANGDAEQDQQEIRKALSPEEEQKFKDMMDAGGTPPQPGTAGAPTQLPLGKSPINAEFFDQQLATTREKLEKEAGGIPLDMSFPGRITQMATNVQGIIATLEEVSSGVGDDFAFQVSLVMRGKDEKYDIAFHKEDFDLMLSELKVLSGITRYLSAYKRDGGALFYYRPVEDIDLDNVYRPDEYFPPYPFGSIIDNPEETLTEAQDLILEGLENAQDAWDLVLERAQGAGSETLDQMLAISAKGETVAILEAQQTLYKDFSTRFNDGFTISLDSPDGPTDVKVMPSVLFNGSLGDIHGLLPCIDLTGQLVPCDDSGNIWPEKTFAGLFPDGLDNGSTTMRKGQVSGQISDAMFTLLKGGDIQYQGGQSKISDKGEFLLANVEYNELIGLTVTVKTSDGVEWKGVIRSPYENLSTIDTSNLSGLGLPGGGSLSIPGLGGGTGTSGPNGRGPSDTINTDKGDGSGGTHISSH